MFTPKILEISYEKPMFAVAHRGTIISSLERLEKIRESLGEEEYVCCIYWLTMPFESLSEEFQKAELEFYRMRRIDDLLIVILDEMMYGDTLEKLREKFGIIELPAMIVTDRMISLKEVEKEDIEAIVFKTWAIKVLIEQNVFVGTLNRLYHLARDGKLTKKRQFWEKVIKPLGRKIKEEVKDFISFQLPS